MSLNVTASETDTATDIIIITIRGDNPSDYIFYLFFSNLIYSLKRIVWRETLNLLNWN